MTYFDPPPGPQHPEKYPKTGKNYHKYGDLSGFLYNPATDQYVPDAKYTADFNKQAGYGPPSLLQQLGPLAAAGFVGAAAQGLGKEIPGLFSGAAKGIFGLGGGDVAGKASSTAAEKLAALQAAQSGAPASGAGSFSLGTGNAPVPTQQAATGGAFNLGNGGGAYPVASSDGGGAILSDGSLDYSAGQNGVGEIGTGVPRDGFNPDSTDGLSADAGGSSLGTAGKYAGYAGIAYEAYNAGKSLADSNADGKEKAQALQHAAALGVADYFTAGLASVAAGVLGNTGIGKKVTGFADKLDAETNPFTLLVGSLGDTNHWKIEGDRLRAIADQHGGAVPQGLLDSLPKGGRSIEEMNRSDLAPDFIGRDPQGNWVNNKFNQSREVSDLRPEDIVNYAAFAEHDPTWFSKTLDDRLALAQKALDAGAVDEHTGTIDVDWGKLPQATDTTGMVGTPLDPLTGLPLNPSPAGGTLR